MPKNIRMYTVEIHEPFKTPKAYDVMLTDLDHTLLLSEVSKELNIQYLKESQPVIPSQEPLTGIM